MAPLELADDQTTQAIHAVLFFYQTISSPADMPTHISPVLALALLSCLKYVISFQLSPTSRRGTILFASSSSSTVTQKKDVTDTPTPRTTAADSDDDEDILNDILIEWLTAMGSKGIKTSIRIDTNCQGLRGLYANRDIKQRENVFEIPYEAALETGDSLSDGVNGEYLMRYDLEDVDGSDDWCKEDVYDVYQGLRLLETFEPDPDYSPYVYHLPPPPESNDEAGLTPDFWSDDIVSSLEVPSYVQQIMQRKVIVKVVAEKNDVDELDLRWATLMVRSRRFTVWDTVDDPAANDDDSFFGSFPKGKKVEQIKGFMLPLIDMANHAHDPNTSLAIAVNRWTRKFDATSTFALRAIRPIIKDEEITLCYGDGDRTSLDFLDKYGFFLDGNEADNDIDWTEMKTEFSSSLNEDKAEKASLLADSKENSTSTMLSLRILLKQLRERAGLI